MMWSEHKQQPRMTPLYIDCETYSELDIREVSTARYTDTCELLIVAWALDHFAVKVWDVVQGPDRSDELQLDIALADRLVAANSTFDRQVLSRCLPYVPVDPAQWDCLFVRAYRAGLPKVGLADLCAFVGLPEEQTKMQEGKALIRTFTRPRTPTKHLPQTRWMPQDKPERWGQFLAYAVRDVVALRAVWSLLPSINDSEFEREVWLLDQLVNARGWPIDIETVKHACNLIDEAKSTLETELRTITDMTIETVDQLDRIKQLLNVDDLTAENVELLLQRADWTPIQRRVLEIRRDASRATNAKFFALRAATSHDQRIRYTLQYGGASRTLRWSGRKFQPQNLIRAPKEYPSPLVAGLLSCKPDLQLLQSTFATAPLDLLAYAIRGMVLAPPGTRLVTGDLSQIEARMVCWLAGHQSMLNVFADPEQDPYVYAAQRIHSDSRQLGKVLTLACGFGMGGLKFRATAAKAPYHLALSEVEAEANVRAWRETNKPIVDYWHAMDAAVDTAMRSPGWHLTECRRHNLTVFNHGGIRYLGIQLPSGRWLLYPHVHRDEYDQVAYSGTTGVVRGYGGLWVENVTQACARDVLAHGMLRAHAAGFNLVGHVHDEVIAEERERSPEQLRECLTQLPAWATGLPLAAECRVTERYTK